MAESFTQSCYGGPKNVSPAEAMTFMQAAKQKGKAGWWRKLSFDYELQSIKGHSVQINVCVAKCSDCNRTFSVATGQPRGSSSASCLSTSRLTQYQAPGEGGSLTLRCYVSLCPPQQYRQSGSNSPCVTGFSAPPPLISV